MVGKEFRCAMNNNTIVTANNFTINKLGNETMVTSESMDDILIINEFGGEILRLILSNKQLSLGDIISNFKNSYSSETLAEDTAEFIQEMNNNGVVTIA